MAATLDALKETGFHWATRSGVTISIEDVVTPAGKAEILERYEGDAEKVEKQYGRGVITDEERRQELIEIWTKATAEVARAMEENFPEDNPVWMMVHSGARGNMMQVRQIAGMRGLVANPKGEIIPRPIKANFREGLTVLEYFISTHGARKGLADTALRTADSGYLTRRLVDVSQDVIIREEDCGTERGVVMAIGEKNAEGTLVKGAHVETSVYARTLADRRRAGRERRARRAGADLGDVNISLLIEAGVDKVKVRCVLTCDSKVGTCAACYGRSLATGKTVDVGEAVGIIAAQSIGEPGTQLTMRTFHTGGVAGDDITQGLPRVVELFEARTPKGVAPISEVAGRVRIDDTDKTRKVVVIPDDGGEEIAYAVSKRARLRITDDSHVEVGEKLHEGAVNPHEVLRILGPRAVQLHLVAEVQEVYRSQGVSIHDKHIEVIIRQMLKRVNVLESGGTDFLPGSLIERTIFETENRRVVVRGRRAGCRPPGPDGHHQGVARDRVVAVGGVLPGDDPRPHRRGDPGQERLAARPQGERHHRQAHPGGHRHQPLPQHPGRAHRGGAGAGLLDGRVRRPTSRWWTSARRVIRRHRAGGRRGRPAREAATCVPDSPGGTSLPRYLQAGVTSAPGGLSAPTAVRRPAARTGGRRQCRRGRHPGPAVAAGTPAAARAGEGRQRRPPGYGAAGARLVGGAARPAEARGRLGLDRLLEPSSPGRCLRRARRADARSLVGRPPGAGTASTA